MAMSPGPWRLERPVHDTCYWRIYENSVQRIVEVFSTKDDARAIAATPDLLAACEGLLEEISPESINAAIAAVAKAKGETSQ